MLLRNLRGALVLFHVLAICIAALPGARGSASEEALNTPAAAAELRTWADRLSVSPQWLQEQVLRSASRADKLHAGLLEPFAPYLHVSGAQQPWALFVAPNRYPTRFQVQVARVPPVEPRHWQTVFEEGSGEFTFRQNVFEHERIRSYFELSSWPRFYWLGPALCRWAARELFAEDAALRAVRCRNYRSASPSPEQVLSGTQNPGEWLHVDQIWR
jgi:hypothetical protein